VTDWGVGTAGTLGTVRVLGKAGTDGTVGNVTVAAVSPALVTSTETATVLGTASSKSVALTSCRRCSSGCLSPPV
jgi:hypothetical protein